MDQHRPVALVTGGAKRVGRAVVERLSDAGFDVAFTYLSSEAEARALCDDLRGKGHRAEAFRGDLGRPDSIEELAERIDRRFARLDVLVNNASLYKPGSLRSASDELRRELWSVHVEAPLLLCRRFEKKLREHHGTVVNMVDLLAERPWPEYLAYCASKAALANLTLGLARELAPEVTVNGIAPGVVEWPENYPPEQKEKYLKRVPLGREGTPGDVADLVHFLCTGGRYVTGQILRLDGGRSIT